MDTFTQGKYAGKTIDEVIEIDPKYVDYEYFYNNLPLTKDQKQRMQTSNIRKTFKTKENV